MSGLAAQLALQVPSGRRLYQMRVVFVVTASFFLWAVLVMSTYFFGLVLLAEVVLERTGVLCCFFK